MTPPRGTHQLLAQCLWSPCLSCCIWGACCKGRWWWWLKQQHTMRFMCLRVCVWGRHSEDRGLTNRNGLDAVQGYCKETQGLFKMISFLHLQLKVWTEVSFWTCKIGDDKEDLSAQGQLRGESLVEKEGVRIGTRAIPSKEKRDMREARSLNWWLVDSSGANVMGETSNRRIVDVFVIAKDNLAGLQARDLKLLQQSMKQLDDKFWRMRKHVPSSGGTKQGINIQGWCFFCFVFCTSNDRYYKLLPLLWGQALWDYNWDK